MKVVGTELEDFMDWAGVIASGPVEEEEMSRLAARMRNRATGSEDESMSRP